MRSLLGFARMSGICALLVIVAIARARADVVGDWNARSGSYLASLPRPVATHALVLVHLAIFDALDAIEPRYVSYHPEASLTAPPATSREAAASSAAATVLATLAPARSTDIDAALQAALAAVPDGPAKADGIALGKRAARDIMALRSNDVIETSQAYVPKTTPGAYVPTSTKPMLFPGVAKMRTFALRSADQFRPAPPALTSAQFARDIVETRRDGAAASAARTPDQTATATFHEDPGAPQYRTIARQLQEKSHLDLLDSARAFALLEMAFCDGQIAVWDAKFTFERLRPETAIAQGGAFYGHPEIAPDPSWKSLLASPMHPEFPCAHCGIGTAAGNVLEAVYGDVPFTLTNADGVTRAYPSVAAFRAEEALSRIYAGVHFRASVDAGVELGRRVAAVVVARLPKRPTSP